MLLSFLRISILSNVIRHLISYNPPKNITLIKTPKHFFIKCTCNVDFFLHLLHAFSSSIYFRFETGICSTFVFVRYFYENKNIFFH